MHIGRISASHRIAAVRNRAREVNTQSPIPPDLQTSRRIVSDSAIRADIHSESPAGSSPACGSESYSKGGVALRPDREGINWINCEHAAVAIGASCDSHPVRIHPRSISAAHRINSILAAYGIQCVNHQSPVPPQSESAGSSEGQVAVGADIDSNRAGYAVPAGRGESDAESSGALISRRQSINRINSESASIRRARNRSQLGVVHPGSIRAGNRIAAVRHIPGSVNLQSLVPPHSQSSRRAVADSGRRPHSDGDIPVGCIAASRSVRNSKCGSAPGEGRRDRVAAAVPAGIAHHRSQSHSARSRHISPGISSCAASDGIAAVRRIIQSVNPLGAVRAHRQTRRSIKDDAGSCAHIQSQSRCDAVPARRAIRDGDVGGLARRRSSSDGYAAAGLRAQSDVWVALGDSAAGYHVAAVRGVRAHIYSAGSAGSNGRIRSRRREDDGAVGADIDRNSASNAVPA